MTSPADIVQVGEPALPAAKPVADPEPAPAKAPYVELSTFDRLAIGAFDRSRDLSAVTHFRELAATLGGPDGDACRRRTIARALAITHAQQEMLDTELGLALREGDVLFAALLDRVLARVDRRHEVLLREHRLETSRLRPATVIGIGSAETVNVIAGKAR